MLFFFFNIRRDVNKTNKSAEKRRFIWYMLYASLSPFLLNIFQLFSDILKSVNGTDSLIVDTFLAFAFACLQELTKNECIF